MSVKKARKPYRDESIFQGWYRYVDDIGNEWRMEDTGEIWRFYKQIEDAFVFDGSVFKRSLRSLRAMHEYFINNHD